MSHFDAKKIIYIFFATILCYCFLILISKSQLFILNKINFYPIDMHYFSAVLENNKKLIYCFIILN